jgi:hypothetical protein
MQTNEPEQAKLGLKKQHGAACGGAGIASHGYPASAWFFHQRLN